MSIKSTVSDTPCKSKELSYPRLMKGKTTGSIYLFVSKTDDSPTVVGEGPDKKFSLGSKGRFPTGPNRDSVKDYTGSVCLENDKS